MPVSTAEGAGCARSGLGVRVADPSPNPNHALAPGAASLARLLGGAHPGIHPGIGASPGSAAAGGAGGWAARAGVLPAWGMRGVAWALLSDAPGALLDACLPQARSNHIDAPATAHIGDGQLHVTRGDSQAKLPLVQECRRRSITNGPEGVMQRCTVLAGACMDTIVAGPVMFDRAHIWPRCFHISRHNRLTG